MSVSTVAAPGRARWCWPTRLLVTAALAWLGGTLAHRLLTGRWWGWLLPDLLPPLAYALVPAALLAALALRPVSRIFGGLRLARALRRPLPARGRRLVLLAALAALGLGLPDTGLNPAALRDAGPVPAGALRIFAWNAEYWDQDDDPARFLDFLVAQRADVYLLQEYLRWDAAAGLGGARPVDDAARLRRAFPGFSIVARGELITLSRYPVLANPPIGPDAAVRADPGADFQRVFTAAKVLRTDLLVGSRVLATYNVHLPVPVNLALDRDFLGFVAERAAARRIQLDALSADIAANPHPLLVAGDLNTSPAMGDLRRLRGRLSDAGHASGSLYPASWPAGAPLALWRLDWCLTSPGIRVHRYALGDPHGLSDHRAQQALISLPEPPAATEESR